MIHAYDKLYLEKARISLAWMLHCAVYTWKIPLEVFFRWFLLSSYSKRFQEGDSHVIAGMSGTELAYRVICENDKDCVFIDPGNSLQRSPEYWLGYYLAYFQWYRGISFHRIASSVSITDALLMYHKYHEVDVSIYVEAMDEILQINHQCKRLQEYRKRVGYSQKQLAEKTGIPIRTIQQYEQGQKDINHARADYLIALAKVLYCTPEDLLENP